MEDNNLQEQEREQENLLKDISRILTDLVKTIKVVSVYPEDNPLPAKLRESFIERLTDIIERTDGLFFKISKGEIQNNNETVYIDHPPDDMLAAIFHNSGITQVSFSPEFGFEEAKTFFRAMKSFINKEEGAEDLVAILWQAEIPGFYYKTLEDITLGEYDGDIVSRETSMEDSSEVNPGSDSGNLQYSAIFPNDDENNKNGMVAREEENAPERDKSVTSGSEFAESQMGLKASPDQKRISLPDTALILNDVFMMKASELEQTASVIAADDELDIYRCTADLLKEILLQENEYSAFSETVTIAEKIQAEFIKLGDLNSAGVILSHLGEVDQLLPDKSIQWKERIRNALIMAGGWEKFSSLVLTINDDSSISSKEIINYLGHFGWEAISAIIDLLGELEHRNHRMAFVEHLINTGKDHVDIISKGIFDRRWFVVRNTALILGEIGNDKAIAYLEKAIKHKDPRVRQEVIRGLTKPQKATNIDLLMTLLWDADIVGKQVVLKAILSCPHKKSLNGIVKIINDDRFITLSQSEQEQLIMAFSNTGGEHAVDYLNSLISKLKFANSETKIFYQKLAFKALSCNSSKKAEEILREYNHSRKPLLRKMSEDALKTRSAIISKGV
jgi:hypothetical protein